MGKLRNRVWCACLVFMAVACVGWATFPSLGAAPLLRVAVFFGMGLGMLGLVFFFPDTSERRARHLIVAAAIFLRLLLWPAPLSDDVNRYVWEGQLVRDGGNPYSAPASDPRWESRRDAAWRAMNHRDQATAYPPGSQWLMAATTTIFTSPLAFKAVAILGDLATLLLLLRLLRRQVAPLRWAGWYAFNPVVLISFAAEGHFDSLMTAALMAAIWSARVKKVSAWLWLGVAIQMKVVCVVLVPLFLTRRPWSGLGLLLAVLILPSLPFIAGWSDWAKGLGQFATAGAFNGPLFAVSGGRWLGFAGLAVSAVLVCVARWRGLALVNACAVLLGAVLVCSPVVHFWYLAWLLPLVALRPSFAWTTLSLTMAGYFVAWWTLAERGWWGFGPAVTLAIWLPCGVAAVLQGRAIFTRRRVRNFPPAVAELSVVIPVFNAGAAFRPLIEKLREELGVSPRIVVVDAASDDGSLMHFPVDETTRVIQSVRGRGLQIAAGIAQTETPWVLVVHADCTPLVGWLARWKTALEQEPGVVLWVFGQRFDHGGLGTLLVEALNELRVLFGSMAFGDQVMMIRREALEASGGFPKQPLMEDVEVSLRLSQHGRVRYLGCEWMVSAQKWRRGFRRRFFLVLRLVGRYQFARLRGPKQAERVAWEMYRLYYPDLPPALPKDT